jgi:hypothetical protein
MKQANTAPGYLKSKEFRQLVHQEKKDAKAKIAAEKMALRTAKWFATLPDE